MSRIASVRFVLLFAAAILAGCATTSAPRAPVDESAAQALADQGDFRGAAAEYERLARANRGQRDHFLLRAAESLREEGDFAAIGETLDKIKRKRLDAGDNLRLDLLLAERALADGDAASALDLATVPSAGAARDLAARAAEIRARALEAQQRTLDAAVERVALLDLVEPAERAGVENDLLEALSRLEPDALNGALVQLPADDARRPWIERALRLKGSVAVRQIPRPTHQVGTLLPGDGAEAPWQREGYQATPRVALIVPLSGTLAPVGTAIRDGFLAAYFADTAERPQVRIFDSGENEQSAIAAYQHAVADGSMRVVGPLMREQVAAVLAQVDPRVPVLALNHPDSGAPPPPGSQQFGLLPDDEAAFVAETAAQRGLRRAAIIAATEEWAERAALAFRAQFELAGGVVAGESRLSGEGVDFAAQIARAASGGADVIFLAVRPTQGRLLVPQLRASGFDRTPVLATSHIYSGTASRALDRDLNGVEFVDAPWLFGLVSGQPARESLIRKLPAAATSPRLFAFGLDAYRLLPYLDWLSRNADAYLDGASGQLTLDSFGRVRRVMALLRFVDGVPQSASGALLPEESPAAATPEPLPGATP